MGLRTWFRRKSKNTTTIKGENMAASVKNLEITLVADGGLSSYQTIRRIQTLLDDTDSLAEVVPSLSRVLSLVKIGDKRAVVAILAETEPGPDLAQELDDLVESAFNGYGREIRKPARGKAAVDPETRLESVAAKAEQMWESVTYLLATALDTVFKGESKKAVSTLTKLGLAARIVQELLDTPVAEESEEEDELVEETSELVPLKRINHVAVKAEPATF
ncbi:hypothetical protein KGQ20_04075 [Catenulispora sp. NF23]|uniref:Uncharacterized protein n=1 Tax=Catenulispora pinistramenti TaxID=2705254 RepID=A0ABS5KJ87_9ACTN|nr:hypothetical protein [Catenulispora pinistramenti]MBS2531941.1 hypothetical protein [Catenulispora pinistramenti]MBS2546208.1 hypothetical protein [Catenulispora pinistramenti]